MNFPNKTFFRKNSCVCSMKDLCNKDFLTNSSVHCNCKLSINSHISLPLFPKSWPNVIGVIFYEEIKKVIWFIKGGVNVFFLLHIWLKYAWSTLKTVKMPSLHDIQPFIHSHYLPHLTLLQIHTSPSPHPHPKKISLLSSYL